MMIYYFILELPYRVVIFPSKKTPSTSATVWVALAGSLGETGQVCVPAGAVEFVFHVSIRN
jgi:hypothetical protein